MATAHAATCATASRGLTHGARGSLTATCRHLTCATRGSLRCGLVTLCSLTVLCGLAGLVGRGRSRLSAGRGGAGRVGGSRSAVRGVDTVIRAGHVHGAVQDVDVLRLNTLVRLGNVQGTAGDFKHALSLETVITCRDVHGTAAQAYPTAVAVGVVSCLDAVLGCGHGDGAVQDIDVVLTLDAGICRVHLQGAGGNDQAVRGVDALFVLALNLQGAFTRQGQVTLRVDGGVGAAAGGIGVGGAVRDCVGGARGGVDNDLVRLNHVDCRTGRVGDGRVVQNQADHVAVACLNLDLAAIGAAQAVVTRLGDGDDAIADGHAVGRGRVRKIDSNFAGGIPGQILRGVVGVLGELRAALHVGGERVCHRRLGARAARSGGRGCARSAGVRGRGCRAAGQRQGCQEGNGGCALDHIALFHGFSFVFW